MAPGSPPGIPDNSPGAFRVGAPYWRYLGDTALPLLVAAEYNTARFHRFTPTRSAEFGSSEGLLFVSLMWEANPPGICRDYPSGKREVPTNSPGASSRTPDQFPGALPVKPRGLEGVVDDGGCGGVEVRLDGLEGVPPADLHHHPGVHVLLNEQPLGEPPAEVVGTHVAVVQVARLLGGGLGRALDCGPDAPDGEVNEGFVRGDVLGVLVLSEGPLDTLGEVGVSGLPARAGSVLPSGHPETVMVGVSLLDMGRLDLGNLESPEPNKPTKLEHHVVPI